MDQDRVGMQRHNPKSDRQGADSRILDIIPESAGPRLATFRGGAVYSDGRLEAQALTADSHFAAVVLAPALRNHTPVGRDGLADCNTPIGTLIIHPASVYRRPVWSYISESMIIALRPESTAEVAAHELDLDHVDLQPPAFGTVDPKALNIAQMLKTELTRQETASELYVDSLITLFCIHLLRTYSGVNAPSAKTNGGLSPSDARRVQEFLNENFTRKLSIAELATVCGLSPGHFIRTFAQTFGQPPHQYILILRLSLAEKLLVEDDLPIAEVAYLSGFSSQSHLTAVMRKFRHLTPAEMRLRK